MRLIERRIGLLFAGFLLCFLVIVGRAFWLQGVQGAQLASEAIYQQTETVTAPGLRGSLLDRRGNELATSEDAATIFATPYQVKNPARAAERLAPILDLDKSEVLESLTADSGFSYVAHKVSLEAAGRVERLELEGIDAAARQPPHLPAGGDGRASGRRRRLRKPGADRARGGGGRDPRRRGRRAPHRQGRARRSDPAGNGDGHERRR